MSNEDRRELGCKERWYFCQVLPMHYLRLDSLATNDVEGQVRIAGVSILTANIFQLPINRVLPFTDRRLCHFILETM
jgi:hypothetical protein